MSSDLKVTNIKHESSSSNNLVLASDGTTTVSGAFTASGGIANAGTITAGTLGSSVVFPAGHIIQSVFSPTITNKDESSSGSSEQAVMDVRGQITLSSSSNGCFVFFNAWVYTSPNTNSYGKVFIRKGNTASSSTILVSQRFGADHTGSVNGPLSVWGFDPSPGSTTPDYVFTIERDSGGTSGTIFLDNADTTKCHLFEVKQ